MNFDRASRRAPREQARLLVELLLGPPMSPDEFWQRVQKIKGPDAFKYARPSASPQPSVPAPPKAPLPVEVKRDPRAHWITAVRPSMWTNFFGFVEGYGHGWDQFKRVDPAHREDFTEAWQRMERSPLTFKVPPVGNWAIKMPWGHAIAGQSTQGRTIYDRTMSPSWVPEHLLDNPYIEQRWNENYARYRAGL